AARGSVPDYQLSAWLMAVCLRSMSVRERLALTRAMARSGSTLGLSSIRAPKADKHSTGGVGDGVSLVLAPLLAAAGVCVPMMSGRGLGHTGGTLDKLESIGGFRVRLSSSAILRQLRSIGVGMFGQSAELAPADRALYALRDATSTVESLPLIVGSILSKKLAEDLDALVLDVKCGCGAIFKDPRRASELAAALVSTANGLGVRCVGLLTGMEQPLGRFVGNALEIRQAVEILRGDFTSSDYVEVTLALGGWMLALTRKARDWREGAEKLEVLLKNGKALERFRAMVKVQGGEPRVADDPQRFLPRAARSAEFLSPGDGFLSRLDARLDLDAVAGLPP
ncbi:MAG: thymidine phosphorylase, partial [Elusimicrobiota bacterium]